MRIRKHDRDYSPNIMVSRGGYESHLDFLEANGFLSEEEREYERELRRKIDSGELKPVPLDPDCELYKALYGHKR